MVSHVEFMRDVRKTAYTQGRVIYDADADYGGWWFCCFPYVFVQENDVLPFFIHCDDVEYGLRCGKKPIIIEGVQVWHETYDKRMTPLMQYYLQISVSASIFSKFGILISKFGILVSKFGISVSNLGILFGTGSFQRIAFMDNLE